MLKNKEKVDLSIIEGKVTAGEDGERRKRTSWTWRQKAWGALVRLVEVLAMNVIIMIVMMFLMVTVSLRWGLALCCRQVISVV